VTRSGWRRAAATLALAAACYGNTLRNDFVWDDRLTAIAPAGLDAILTRRTGDYYRPVVMLSFAADRALWGTTPAGFHATNLVMHALTGVLVGELAVAMAIGEGGALAASLLFVAHPVQADAVAYVSGRTDVLCAVFLLAALLAWRRARTMLDGWAVATGVLVALALGCKEAAVLAPLVLLVPGAHPNPQPPRPIVPLGIATLWLVLWMGGGGPGVHLAGVAARLPAIAATALDYLRLLVWPSDLHLERFVPVAGWSAGVAIGMWAAVIAVALALALAARGAPGGWVLLALAAATYAPVSGIVPVYPAIADRALFAAEHFLYLPLCGLVPLVAAVAARRLPARAGAAGTLLCLAVWTPLVVARNRDWRDEATLFAHTLRYDPPAARVWYDLGNLRLAAGDSAEAERLYRAAIARAPRDAAAYLNLGIALGRQGRREEAMAAYAEAVRLDPKLADAFRRP